MAETKTKKAVIKLTTNVRYNKKTIPKGTLIRIAEAIAKEWVKDECAEYFDTEQIKIVEL